ncbi:MAG: hypothetical protein ACOX3S_04330 [Anaerolineae bacterium]|jgi:hypothetical protein
MPPQRRYHRARVPVARAALARAQLAPPADRPAPPAEQDAPPHLWDVVLLAAGPANGLLFDGQALANAAPLFTGRPVYIDHALPAEEARPGGRSVRDLAGRIVSARWDGRLGLLRGRVALLPAHAWLADLARRLGDADWFGLSADLWLERQPEAQTPRGLALQVRRIVRVNSVDVVMNPAAGGRFVQPIEQRKEHVMSEQRSTLPTDAALQRLQAAQSPDDAPDAPVSVDGNGDGPHGLPPAATAALTPLEAAVLIPIAEYVEAQLRAARLPEALAQHVRHEFAGGGQPEAVRGRIAALQSAWAEARAQASISGLGRVSQMRTGLDRLTLAFERLLGLPETAAHRDAERLTGIRELYDRLTGDWERTGLFRGERVALANANTTTMAAVTANVLNKALLHAYEQREHWWRPIAHQEDFTTLNDVRWITVGGFSDLDTVAEGDAYVEKTWGDVAESSAFVKKGNYIGLTLEMIDRDDVAAVRAIPQRLGLAAYRTLSAAVASLFTANSGAGVALADEAYLFSQAHSNLGSTALDATSWDAAVQAMFTQTEPLSNKRLGIQPAYCLVPIELQKTAVGLFTTALEPGRAGNTRAIERLNHSVITVPDWTDASDWVAAADPADLAGVCIGYRFGRAPELFVADSPSAGSMFTHDELRIKVRFVYAVGIGDYRALYKAIVADE